jgi:hypothetical protein
MSIPYDRCRRGGLFVCVAIKGYNVNYTIIGDQMVNDPAAPGGRKIVTQFVMSNASFLSEILTVYRNTQNGSMSQDLSTGDVYFLLGGVWSKLGG